MLLLNTEEVNEHIRLLFFTGTIELEKMTVWHKICNFSFIYRNQFSHRVVSF